MLRFVEAVAGLLESAAKAAEAAGKAGEETADNESATHHSRERAKPAANGAKEE